MLFEHLPRYKGEKREAAARTNAPPPPPPEAPAARARAEAARADAADAARDAVEARAKRALLVAKARCEARESAATAADRECARLKRAAALTAPRLAAKRDSPVARFLRPTSSSRTRESAPPAHTLPRPGRTSGLRRYTVDEVDAADDDRVLSAAHARTVAGGGYDLRTGGRAPAAWRQRRG